LKSTPVLLTSLLSLFLSWRTVFAQDRLYRRAVRLALGSLSVVGTATLTRILASQGRDEQDWTADYRLFSQRTWNPNHLFDALLPTALGHYPDRGPVVMALDDTRLRKVGKRIATAGWHRDPLSPAFHTNLHWGLRFLAGSLLLPLYRESKSPPRALPLRFTDIPPVKKPGKRASEEEWQQFKEQQKQHNLSTYAVTMARSLRTTLDEAGVSHRTVLLVGDNSFCNRRVLRAELDRVTWLVRARKDAVLCCRAPAGGRRIYAKERFTPESVRQDKERNWKQTRIWHAGKHRLVRYKEVPEVLWRTGTQQRSLRLIVLAPTRYRKNRKKTYYRAPAYLLTTDRTSSIKQLVQAYWDRWQIEVQHKEVKDTLGAGQAQVRVQASVERQPAFVVACYAALLLASLEAFGTQRAGDYEPLPKWRRNATRPSCQDLIGLLRREIVQQSKVLEEFDLETNHERLVRKAAA
jgi:Transposase DDE domain